MAEQLDTPRSIPSLDGLRAFAVLAVILGHTESPYLDRIPFIDVFRNGQQGVAFFFVISGFLITHLLLKELGRDGKITLGRFYFRRTMRIFPPFYVYLLAIAVLGVFHLVEVSSHDLISAATYSWNYVPFKGDHWILGHCWSLSLEEQFYLLWPACIAFFSRRTNLKLAIWIILLSPVSRLATYFLWPAMRGHMNMMLHTHLDTIMTGCALSLLIDLKLAERYIKICYHWAAPVAALVFLFAVDTPMGHMHRGAVAYKVVIGLTLENVAIAAFLLHVVFHSSSVFGKLLNFDVLKHLGMISYSLYLWQQLFTGPYTRSVPLNLLCILACAEASYFLVERPSFRLRDFIQRRFLRRPALPVAINT